MQPRHFDSDLISESVEIHDCPVLYGKFNTLKRQTILSHENVSVTTPLDFYHPPTQAQNHCSFFFLLNCDI